MAQCTYSITNTATNIPGYQIRTILRVGVEAAADKSVTWCHCGKVHIADTSAQDSELTDCSCFQLASQHADAANQEIQRSW